MNNEKNKLIEDIKLLISSDNKAINFNIKYIEYFELDELIDIKEQLKNKKESNKTPSKDFLDEIFNSCS